MKEEKEKWFRENQENVELVDYDEYSNVLYIEHSGDYSVLVSPKNAISIRG